MRWITAALLLGLVTSCSREVEFAPPPPPEVTTARPLQERIEPTVDFIGRTEAVIVEVRARIRGDLLEVHFDQSSEVKEGDLLFSIEPDIYAADVAAAEAEVAVAEANLQLADATLQRMEKALETNAVSVLDVLQARGEKAAAIGKLDRAKAVLEDAQITLSYTEIHAPMDGRISRSLVDPGNLVGATEATLLTTIVAEDPMDVVFNVDERTLAERIEQRPRAETDQRDLLRCRLDLAGGRRYEPEGRVTFADNVVDEDTGTLQLRATFPNSDGLLVSGMFGRVKVIDDPVEATLVPETAVQRDLAGHFLMVVEDGKATRRDVEVGFDFGRMTVIEEGLEPNDQVIVKGLQRVRDGSPVNPTETQLDPALLTEDDDGPDATAEDDDEASDG